MSKTVDVTFDTRQLAPLGPGRLDKAIGRALSKAGSTGLRDMRSEASKRIRARKRLKLSTVNKTLVMRRAKRSSIDGEWGLDVSGMAVPLVAYPHRQTQKGVSVEVNRGKRTLLPHAFLARMRSGHEGVFMRSSQHRLPITELLGSRPVDALLHAGEADAVAARGAASMTAAFERLLPMEMAKVKGG